MSCQLHSRWLKPLNLSLVFVYLVFIYLTSPSLVLLSPVKNREQPSSGWVGKTILWVNHISKAHLYISQGCRDVFLHLDKLCLRKYTWKILHLYLTLCSRSPGVQYRTYSLFIGCCKSWELLVFQEKKLGKGKVAKNKLYLLHIFTCPPCISRTTKFCNFKTTWICVWHSGHMS